MLRLLRVIGPSRIHGRPGDICGCCRLIEILFNHFFPCHDRTARVRGGAAPKAPQSRPILRRDLLRLIDLRPSVAKSPLISSRCTDIQEIRSGSFSFPMMPRMASWGKSVISMCLHPIRTSAYREPNGVIPFPGGSTMSWRDCVKESAPDYTIPSKNGPRRKICAFRAK
jgi:hypothetical protein